MLPSTSSLAFNFFPWVDVFALSLFELRIDRCGRGTLRGWLLLPTRGVTSKRRSHCAALAEARVWQTGTRMSSVQGASTVRKNFVRVRSLPTADSRCFWTGKPVRLFGPGCFFLINRFFGTFELISYLQSKEITTIRYRTESKG